MIRRSLIIIISISVPFLISAKGKTRQDTAQTILSVESDSLINLILELPVSESEATIMISTTPT